MGFEFKISWSDKKKKSTEQQTIINPEYTPEDFEKAVQNAFTKVDKDIGVADKFSTAGLATNPNEIELPVKGGRTSVYEGTRSGFGNKNTPEATTFPFQHLQFLQNLAMWNRHISLAVENIVTLGNTPYEIDFGDTGQEQAKQMRKHLDIVVPNWYEFSDGEASLDNDLLAQTAIYGAISAEGVVKKNLSGISKIVRVDPYYIRFAYDDKKDIHVPLQQAEFMAKNKRKLSSKYPGYIELNTRQYCYIAARRFTHQPYGVPPFISAIEDLLIENDMIKNFANVMRRLGMLGLLSVLVRAPKANSSETPAAYQDRMVKYLQDIMPGIEDGLHKGVIVGFKDSHDIQATANNLNAGEGENLLRMVKSLVYSGLKQDPNMHGENFSTTETFGRVILAKMSRQIANYQGVLAGFKERMFKLELVLAGFTPDLVRIKYEAPTISDRKAEAETDKINIANARELYNDGLISQDRRAEILTNITGQEEPDQDEPRFAAPVLSIDGQGDAKTKDETDTGESSEAAASRETSVIQYKKLLLEMGAGRKEYDYEIPDGCDANSYIDVTDFKEPKMKSFVRGYLNEADEAFNVALDKSIPSMVKSVEVIVGFDETPSAASLEASLMVPLLQQWGSTFKTPVTDIAEDHITNMYGFFRKDEKPFRDAENFEKQGREKASLFTIPEATFTLLDARAIEYLSSLDAIWLGKFITDQDTLRRITRFIENEVIGKNLTLGRNGEAVKQFVERFTDEVRLEAWKMRRIIETTANKVRNTANVMYIDQAGVQKYEVVEVLDEKTCGWCRHMHGKTFNVSRTVDKLQKATDTPNTDISAVTPFATSVNLDEFTQLGAQELQALGHDVPSYHPHCRGRIVADL